MADISIEIKNILRLNEIEDLKNAISKRNFLNKTNIILSYIFHILQASGVLTTTIAAGYNIKYLVWVGVGMNCTASLINIFEQINNNMSKKLLVNIKSIKEGTFVDESLMIDPEIDNLKKDQPPPSLLK